ncbi:MAG: LysR family transcriptional regulator, partial [Alcaligenaceae bacterium]|nr:LysR family transcriptional regulator [Alcaligenaceae bacterium]
AGSLLKASGRMHVAQPALGQQIAALEHDLGARLLDRSSRGVTPTEAGKVFLEHARLVLADAERARQAVRQSTTVPSGDVALGLTTTVALAATMPILSASRRQLPQVKLKVVEAYSGFLRERLQSGRLDLALLYDDASDPGLSKHPLLDDQLMLVTSARHALPQKVSLTELTRSPLVLPGLEHGLRRIIEDACAPQSLELNVVAEIESLSSVKRAVEAGIGHTILPLGSVAEEVAQGRLRTTEIDDRRMSRRVVCATNTTRPSSVASTAVVQLILEVTREMVESGAWPAKWVGNAHLRPLP